MGDKKQDDAGASAAATGTDEAAAGAVDTATASGVGAAEVKLGEFGAAEGEGVLTATGGGDVATVQAALDAEREAHEETKGKLDHALSDLAAANKAKNAAKATAKPAGDKARKVGPLDQAPDADTLGELLAAGGMFELVPSDGKKEVLAMPPVEIAGDAWLKSGSAMKLRVPVRWCPTAAASVAGFGLFDDDGKQIAYQALPDPVTIAAGQEMSFDQAIFF